jgi:GH25 family lysozyme M1 (1,4-beta-N-acetylmuramidase)
MKFRFIYVSILLSCALNLISCNGDGGGSDDGTDTGFATLTLSPASGNTTKAFIITVSSDKTGYDIFYTLNGSDPTDTDTEYTGSIPVTANGVSVHIKAAAMKNGSIVSNIAEGTWSLTYDYTGSSTNVVTMNATVVEGIDVSSFTTVTNWTNVAAAKKFVFIRATSGVTADTKFASYWAGAKTAGITRSPYHFYNSSLDPDDQADAFLGTFTLEAGDLPPVIDIENNPGNLSKEDFSADLASFINRIVTATGKMPIIYTASSFWNTTMGGCTTFANCPLFIAHWGVANPTITTSWSTCTFWQYSSNGSVSGITGIVDLNRFNGSLAEMTALCVQ